MSTCRVRFAPSPTGPLHIGGVRTALFNYLFAKQHNGKFILRIEDTDQKRYVKNAEDYIIESLEWAGIAPDEGQGYGGEYGPYRQSERKEIYQKYAQQLIDEGRAYYAFDLPDELDTLRKSAEAKGQTFIYNYTNRNQLTNSLNLSAEDVQSKIKSGEPYVIRFLINPGETLYMHDLIRGKVNIDTSTLDDKILMKADGMPTYHLANIVDDHLMHISHVIRGEEWLPSMALHILLYQAFGWKTPHFAHLPLILKPEGKGKLSKRDGDKHGFPVFPMEWKSENGIAKGYKEEGYLPQAFINMLALLGWNSGTEQELFSLDELVNLFSLEKVSKSGARFDPKKTIWFNHQHLQRLPLDELTQKFQVILNQNQIESNFEFDAKVVESIKERANFVQDIWTIGQFFYQAPKNYDDKAFKKVWKENTGELLSEFSNQLQSLKNFTQEPIHDLIQSFVTQKEIGFGKLMMPVRVAIVGTLQGPDIPLVMEMLGKEKIISRVQNLIDFGNT